MEVEWEEMMWEEMRGEGITRQPQDPRPFQ